MKRQTLNEKRVVVVWHTDAQWKSALQKCLWFLSLSWSIMLVVQSYSCWCTVQPQHFYSADAFRPTSFTAAVTCSLSSYSNCFFYATWDHKMEKKDLLALSGALISLSVDIIIFAVWCSCEKFPLSPFIIHVSSKLFNCSVCSHPMGPLSSLIVRQNGDSKLIL